MNLFKFQFLIVKYAKLHSLTLSLRTQLFPGSAVEHEEWFLTKIIHLRIIHFYILHRKEYIATNNRILPESTWERHTLSLVKRDCFLIRFINSSNGSLSLINITDLTSQNDHFTFIDLSYSCKAWYIISILEGNILPVIVLNVVFLNCICLIIQISFATKSVNIFIIKVTQWSSRNSFLHISNLNPLLCFYIKSNIIIIIKR